MRSSFSRLLPLLLITGACSAPSPAPPPAKPSGDAAFTEVGQGLPRRHLPASTGARDIARYPQIRRAARRSVAAGCRRRGRGFADVPRARGGDRCVDADAEQSARPRADAPRHRRTHPDARDRPALGARSRHLQQRRDQRRLPHDQARVRAARGTAAPPDRAGKSDARSARRSAEEPRESGEDPHRDRHRADRRQPRLLQDCSRRGLPYALPTKRCSPTSSSRTTPSLLRSTTTRSG